MSELTLPQLLSCDSAPFDQAALAWLAVAEDFDNAAEVFIRATRELPDAWPEGEASEAAQRRAAVIRAELSNAYQPARRIGQALQWLADGMVQLRQQAEMVLAAARRDGLQVDVAAGYVSAPAHMYHGGSTADHVTRMLNSYMAELHSVLERARGLDDQTVRIINENLPDPVLGFGTAVPAPVSRDQVLAQQGRDPWLVRMWWESLTPAQQEQVIAEYPEMVGWLDGVPATDRDTANRLRLANDLEDLRGRADELRQQIAALEAAADSPGERRSQAVSLGRLYDELQRVEADLAQSGQVEAALAGLGGQGLLLGYDPAGDGKAIVAVGNPDMARHTATWVPGVDSTLDNVQGNVERVQNLQEQADDLTEGIKGDVAAIMWLGYDAPERDLSLIGHERSEQGGRALDAFINGLHATHAGGDYHVTAVGHSYGSTVVAEAARGPEGLAVRDIVVAGSPGMHAEHASELNTDPRHVWAGSAKAEFVSDMTNHPDVVPWQGAPHPVGEAASGVIWAYEQGHGDSPHRPEFGANRFHVDTTGHGDYWQKETVSLRNQAFIVVGQYNRVALDHGSPPS